MNVSYIEQKVDQMFVVSKNEKGNTFIIVGYFLELIVVQRVNSDFFFFFKLQVI